MIEVKHRFDGKKGAFYYQPGSAVLAEMVYNMANESLMIIEHTEVDESLKGQGIGLQLLETLIAYVREKEIKLIPLCPFANAMIQKHPEWQDTLSVLRVKPAQE